MMQTYVRANVRRDTSGGCKIDWGVALASICLFMPALFNDIMPYSARNLILVVGCVVAAALFLRHMEFNLLGIGIGFGWLAFAIFAVINRNITGGSLGFPQLALPLSAFAACLGACSTRWLKTTLLCILVMLGINLAATLLFYIVPDLYISTVKTKFFYNERNAIGYQSGLTSHYSNNGLLMVLGFLLTTSMAMASEGRQRKEWTVLSILFLFALVLTQKRGHLLFGVFAFICLFSMSALKGKVLKSAIAILIVFVLGVLAVSYIPGVGESFDRLVSVFDGNDMAETTSGRTYLWAAAIAGWKASPLFGNGWGSFVYTWPGGNLSIYAHNEILQILNDVGIAGLIIFLVLTLSTLILSFHNIKIVKYEINIVDINIRTAVYFAFALQVFFIIYSFTTGGLLQQPLIYVPYFLSVGITLSVRYYLIKSCGCGWATRRG